MKYRCSKNRIEITTKHGSRSCYYGYHPARKHDLQAHTANQYKSKVSRKQKHSISRENDTFKEAIKHVGYHPKLKVNPSASNWDSSDF